MSKSAVKVPGSWPQRILAYLWYDVILFGFTAPLEILVSVFTSAPTPDMTKMERRSGHVAVITGGPRGLSLGMIKRLVQLDCTVIMGVRDISDCKRRLAKLAESNKQLSFGKVEFLEMDLRSFESVRKFADALLKRTDRIDLLLCNAAVLLSPYEITVDGYETQIQVNYLSHFLLTHLLMERLKKTGSMKGAPCQVIYSSSCFHKYTGFNVETLPEKPTCVYSPARFYGPSKLYPVMSMIHLQRLLYTENAKVNLYAVHPGVIITDLTNEMTFPFRQIIQNMGRFMRSVQQGADTILWPFLSRDYLHRGGIYMESGKPVSISAVGNDKDKQRFVYKKSLQLVGLEKNEIGH